MGEAMETVDWLDKEKAAGMFLVAWVKDWSLVNLVQTLAQKHVNNIDEEFVKEVHKQYPFMPSQLDLYFQPYRKHTKFSYTKRFISDNYPKLNDALYEAKDNKEILELKPRVLRLVCPNINRKAKFSKEESEQGKKERRAERAIQESYFISRRAFTQGHGKYGWKTVK